MELTKNLKKPARSALGRGLSSLISAAPVTVAPQSAHIIDITQSLSSSPQPQIPENAPTVDELANRPVQYIPISKITPNPTQPRQRFNEQEVAELAGSIKTLGVLQPVLVRPCTGDRVGMYEIVAGERRWRAASRAGLERLPAFIRHLDDRETLEIALVENVQRSNLNPVEEARGYQRLIDEFSLSQKDVAERVGKDRASVANYVRLLSLPEGVLELVNEGKLSLGHAKAILSVREPVAQMNLARKAVQENLSVRALETIVSRVVVLDGGRKPRQRRGAVNEGDVGVEVIDRMRRALGTKVVVKHHTSGRGKIEIEYFSEQELDRIVDQICK